MQMASAKPTANFIAEATLLSDFFGVPEIVPTATSLEDGEVTVKVIKVEEVKEANFKATIFQIMEHAATAMQGSVLDDKAVSLDEREHGSCCIKATMVVIIDGASRVAEVLQNCVSLANVRATISVVPFEKSDVAIDNGISI